MKDYYPGGEWHIPPEERRRRMEAVRREEQAVLRRKLKNFLGMIAAVILVAFIMLLAFGTISHPGPGLP